MLANRLTTTLKRLNQAKSYLAIIIGRIASGLPWFLRSTAVLMQLSAGACVGCGSLNNSVFDIRSLTWDEWSYPKGVMLLIVTLGTIRPEDSGAARNATGVSALKGSFG